MIPFCGIQAENKANLMSILERLGGKQYCLVASLSIGGIELNCFPKTIDMNQTNQIEVTRGAGL